MDLERTLLLGYGNQDRGDDGVAWHILGMLAKKLKQPILQYPGEIFHPKSDYPDLMFTLQLTPELSETLAKYDRICFIDAHTGAIPEKVQIINIEASFQTTPFTHHLTPHICLCLAENLFNKKPSAVLVSVRGYDFDFKPSLSNQTAILAEEAFQIIWDWLHSRNPLA